MGFVNRELKENERREYVLKEKVKDYKYSNYIAKFDSGTIDNENDVRMFIYGDAMKSYESPFWDMNDFHTKYGILDYKGEVIYFTAEVYSNDGNLSWYVKEFYTDEKIDEKEEFLV